MKKLVLESVVVERADPGNGRWSVLSAQAWSPGRVVLGLVWRWEIEGGTQYVCSQHLDEQPPILRQTDICIDIAEDGSLIIKAASSNRRGYRCPVCHGIFSFDETAEGEPLDFEPGLMLQSLVEA